MAFKDEIGEAIDTLRKFTRDTQTTTDISIHLETGANKMTVRIASIDTLFVLEDLASLTAFITRVETARQGGELAIREMRAIEDREQVIARIAKLEARKARLTTIIGDGTP